MRLFGFSTRPGTVSGKLSSEMPKPVAPSSGPRVDQQKLKEAERNAVKALGGGTPDGGYPRSGLNIPSNRPPGGGGGGGGGDGGDRGRNQRISELFNRISAQRYSPDAKLNSELFMKMMKAGTPADLMGLIQMEFRRHNNAVLNASNNNLLDLLRKKQSTRLEVSAAILFGTNLKTYQSSHYDSKGSLITVTDVETTDFMIEVTIGVTGKSTQMSNMCRIAGTDRHVILYAPNYGEQAAAYVFNNFGVRTVRDKVELLDLCSALCVSEKYKQ